MLNIIRDNRYTEVVVTSLIRLLANCNNDSKWETLTTALNGNPSPLVRAAAATSLDGNFSQNVRNTLVKAASDDTRLVRISAAATLAGSGENQFTGTEKNVVANATKEYLESMVARPDDWSSHYNLGIYHQNTGDANKALESYETAIRLYPESLIPFINSSVLYSYTGNQAKAEENLRKALGYAPENEAINLNLGLLLAEQGKNQEAEKALSAALNANPKQAVAAYNLSVLTAQRNINEAAEYAKIAAEARPEEPKYAYTLAYYQFENNQKAEAQKTLKKLIQTHPLYLNGISFLADIYMKNDRKEELISLYEQTIKTEGISIADKNAVKQALDELKK